MRTTFKSIFVVTVFLLLNSAPLFAEEQGVSNTVIGNGIGIGSALAIAICWTRTNSVLTSILAGILGWLYVIYFCIVRENESE